MEPTSGTLNIQLSYASSRSDDGEWRLIIEDPTSGVPVIEATLSHEDFARVVGTNAYQVTVPGRILAKNADKWGKDFETQTIKVMGLDGDTWDDRHAMIDAAIAEVEGDGWFLHDRVDSDGSTRSTGRNGHRQDSDGYRVNIGRYVNRLDGVEEITEAAS